jgi:hypothetical protein
MYFEYQIAFAPLKDQLLIPLDLFIIPVAHVTTKYFLGWGRVTEITTILPRL